MKETKNPFVAKVDKSNGDYEVVVAKKFSDTEEPVYKKFMGMCAMMDAYAVDTKDMDDDQTSKACASLFDQSMGKAIEKVEANLFEMNSNFMESVAPAKEETPVKEETDASLFDQMNAGLTSKQKKNLPPELQRAILKKSKAEKKISASLFDQMDAMLKEKEVGPKGELKVVEKPKISKAAHELPADAKKKLAKIASELDSAVKMHTSQSERIRDMLS